MLFFRWKER